MSPRIVIAKLLGSLATLAFVVVFNFFLFRVVEGDPVANLFRGRNLSDSQREELTREFGLDGSKLEQFWSYVQQTLEAQLRPLLHHEPAGDRGDRRQGAGDDRARRRVGAAVGGVRDPDRGRWRRGGAAPRRDYAATTLTMTTYSMPDFWLGMLLLSFFAVTLGWLPVGGIADPNGPDAGIGKLLDQAEHLLLPAITLTVAYLGEYALVMRSSLIETMREDYLVLARAKGLRDVLVRNRHAVPNALLPVVTLVAINFGFVLSGAIAVETIFSWPGLGLATYEALQGPDLPMLQGLFLVFSAAVIFFNLLADLLYTALDPRVRAA